MTYILWPLKVLHVQAEVLQGIENVDGKESQVRVAARRRREKKKEEEGNGMRRREQSRSKPVIVVVQ